MKRSNLFLLTALLGTLLAAMGAPARAGDNDGQADLDKAFEKKLASATSTDDLGEVLSLCDSAIKKGLSPTNLQFANDLYNSTLLQRGTFYTQRAFAQIEAAEAAPAEAQMKQELALANKDRESALADLGKLVGRDPKEGTAYLMTARLQSLRKQDHPAALKAADKAVELIKDEPNLQAAALVVRGQLQTDQDKELADFDAAVKLVPTDSDALWLRAVLLDGKKKYEAALADLDALVKQIPKNLDGEENAAARARAIRIHEARGKVLFQLKRNDQALASFEESIKLQPNSTRPYLDRAEIRAELKDFKGALDDLNAALGLDPDSSVVLLTRARVYQLSGDLKNARADVDAVLKNNNPDAVIEALEQRASISAEEKDFAQAIKDLEELAKIAPKNPKLLLQIGMVYAANKQSRKAIEKYDAALAIDDKNWHIYCARGEAYLILGQQAEAVGDFEKATKISPKNLDLLLQIGTIYAANKQSRKAIEKYDAALAIDDKPWQLYRARGDAYLNLGKQAEAIKDYEKAIQGYDKSNSDADESGLLNNLAWVLATSPDAKLRDARRSIELGTKACEQTKYQESYILSTLAAAYAEKGDFDSAVKWSAKAVEVSDAEMKPELEKELRSYKGKKPWRELLKEDETPKTKAAGEQKPGEKEKPSNAPKPDGGKTAAQKPPAEKAPADKAAADK